MEQAQYQPAQVLVGKAKMGLQAAWEHTMRRVAVLAARIRVTLHRLFTPTLAVTAALVVEQADTSQVRRQAAARVSAVLEMTVATPPTTQLAVVQVAAQEAQATQD